MRDAQRSKAGTDTAARELCGDFDQRGRACGSIQCVIAGASAKSTDGIGTVCVVDGRECRAYSEIAVARLDETCDAEWNSDGSDTTCSVKELEEQKCEWRELKFRRAQDGRLIDGGDALCKTQIPYIRETG